MGGTMPIEEILTWRGSPDYKELHENRQQAHLRGTADNSRQHRCRIDRARYPLRSEASSRSDQRTASYESGIAPATLWGIAPLLQPAHDIDWGNFVGYGGPPWRLSKCGYIW